MPTTRGYAAPPQGQGYYDRRTGRWWDNHVGHFLPQAPGTDQLEVYVEEVRNDSWLARHCTPAARLLCAPRYRFVGDARSDDPRWPSYRVMGDVFSTRRARILGGALGARPWAPTPQQHLNNFASHLIERGWQPASHGDQWWSLQLTRPCVQWSASEMPASASDIGLAKSRRSIATAA